MVFEDKMVILEFFTFCTEIVFHDTLNALFFNSIGSGAEQEPRVTNGDMDKWI